MIIAVWGKGYKGTHRRVVKEGFLEEVWLDWNSGQVWLAGYESEKALKVEGRSETRYTADGRSVAHRAEEWGMQVGGKHGWVKVLEERRGESPCLPCFE